MFSSGANARNASWNFWKDEPLLPSYSPYSMYPRYSRYPQWQAPAASPNGGVPYPPSSVEAPSWSDKFFEYRNCNHPLWKALGLLLALLILFWLFNSNKSTQENVKIIHIPMASAAQGNLASFPGSSNDFHQQLLEIAKLAQGNKNLGSSQIRIVQV